MPPSSASLKRVSAAPTRTGRARPVRPARHLLARRAGHRQPARRGCAIGSNACSARAGSARSISPGAWAARRTCPAIVCIKVSERIDGWLREAYFGQLLDGHPRAIRVFDAFPLLRPDGRVLYCLALEYARHGDLRAFLHRTGKGWPEAVRAPRDRGHPRGARQAAPRPDAAPRPHADERVRVRGPPPEARATSGSSGSRATAAGSPRDTMNPLTAPSDILAGAAPKWQARDDVYQVGQLLGMLVKGDARARIRTARDPPAAVQRSPEGDRLPLHRRAAQALRERRRADRGAAQPAGPAARRARCGRSRACTSRSPAS